MKRNLIIGTVAAVALAAPAGVYAASPGPHSSIDVPKVEKRDVMHHDPSRDPHTAWRADDMKSPDSRSDGSGGSGDSRDKTSSDGSWSRDGGFDR